MSAPLLLTKLTVPPLRPFLIPRSRLINRLNHGLQNGHKLSLISAPAGFGKTTLAKEWIEALGAAVPPTAIAWLSLDEEDNDPARFLAYVITALNQIEGTAPTFGKRALALLQSPQPPPAEAALTPLINEIATIPGKFALILDDYHLIDAQPIHEALSFLLENSPPQLHLVIATREDPHLPLSRLRARGQLSELRAADLRFTSSEAADFLNQVMGLNLSAEDIAALETRTEGWITGLQLAALALRGQLALQGSSSQQRSTRASEFIKSFTGSHRYVLDYLIEEVLGQQPGTIQTFLLQTAVLNRLTGSLCNAVTGQENGQEILEMLERANLFIVPLDDERRWYRYHHLFADLLRQRLRQTDADQVPRLHLKASEWYLQDNQLAEAIHHALAAEDFEQVADLTELAWRPMNMRYRAVTWLGWVKAIPDDLVRSRPALSAGCGWASLDAGNLEAAEMYLQAAERGLEAALNVKEQILADKAYPQGGVKRVGFDEVEFRSLSASIANARAYLAQAHGDMTGTVKHAQRATDFLDDNDYFERGLAEILPGFAYWASGELESAYKAIAEAISNMQKTGKISFVISFTSYLADIMVAQGRLEETKETYLQLLETATRPGEPEVPETAVLHLGLSELYLEQNELETARWHLQRSEELGKQQSFAPWYRHWIFAHARMLNAQGDLDGVIELLSQAERLYYRHPIPDIRPLKSLMARAWLAQGKLGEAWRCVHQQGLFVADDLSYLREYEHITFARLLITHYQRDQEDDSILKAIALLDRLLRAAEEGRRIGSVIEILVLQAVAFGVQSNTPCALTSLERALALAEPAGYVRIFADEGPPLAHLLYRALDRGIAPGYVRRLLTAISANETSQADSTKSNPDQSELIEPLSERELEVLQLIAEGLTNPEIASRLFLSLNTVKVHTRNIYGKLDAHSRTQAVAKASSLGVLAAL